MPKHISKSPKIVVSDRFIKRNQNNISGRFGGFGNYFVPIFAGAPEVAFPRINSISLFKSEHMLLATEAKKAFI